jgi:hypothetical protein
MSTARTQFTGGLDLPDNREHGVDVSIEDFAPLETEEAKAKLASLSRAERVAVLFGFEPFDYQRDLIDYTENSDVTKVAVRPGRQVGKTLTGAVLAAHNAAVTTGEDTLIAAPFQETADEMMREATSLLETAEPRLDSMGMSLGVETKNKREWEFSHGGRLLSRTLGVDGVGQRGKSPTFIICDEAAYVSDGVFENVIEPFLATHQRFTFILTSTPAGDAGYFFDKCKLDEDWHSPYWPTAISPLVEAEWLAERKRKTEARTWRQEYLGEFIGSSDRFFSPELIDSSTDHDAALGNNLVTIGADIARAGDDRTAIIGVDDTGTAGVLVSDTDMTLTDAAGRLSRMYDEHNPDSILVDETGLGAGVVEMLESEVGGRVVEGVKFTIDRKQSLYNGLKSALEAGEVVLAHHPRLARELKKLTYSLTAGGKTKISHPDNGRDDHPDALALAADGYGGRTSSDDILAFQL